MERCAIVGVGQTHHKAKRDDVSIAGMVREAAKMALEDADLGWGDIDAVVIGKAPDMFEGVMMPELYLAPALGAVGKPMFRVHTAGSVGGSTALVAAHLITSGTPPPGADGGLREAVRLGRDVGALGAAAVCSPAARGCRWVLRTAHPRVHAALGRARPHRPDGRGQGPPERDAQSVRTPPHPRHRHEDGRGFDDAVGAAPLPRVLPLLGRSGGDGPLVGVHALGHVPARVDPRDGHALEPTMFAGRDQVDRGQAATAPPTSTGRRG